CRSRELICWLTADWVTELICAAFVKLSDSARSQNTFRLSICMQQVEIKKGGQVNGSSAWYPVNYLTSGATLFTFACNKRLAVYAVSNGISIHKKCAGAGRTRKSETV